MSSTRTRVYLTRDQRRQIDGRARRERKTMAEVVRDAVDHYLAGDEATAEEALRTTFGRLPALETPPRDEWSRGGD